MQPRLITNIEKKKKKERKKEKKTASIFLCCFSVQDLWRLLGLAWL